MNWVYWTTWHLILQTHYSLLMFQWLNSVFWEISRLSQYCSFLKRFYPCVLLRVKILIVYKVLLLFRKIGIFRIATLLRAFVINDFISWFLNLLWFILITICSCIQLIFTVRSLTKMRGIWPLWILTLSSMVDILLILNITTLRFYPSLVCFRWGRLVLELRIRFE